MKTQEEIDEVYKKLYLSLDDSPHYHTWVRGYTQCQEDMADKKYTEEAMLFAFVHGGTKFEENKDASMLNKNFKELISSLNKQD